MSELIHKYRLFKTSYGIAIDLYIEVYMVLDVHKALRVTDEIYFLVDSKCNLNNNEIDFLHKGLKFVSENIDKQERLLINIKNVEYNPCDYQPEGLTLAIIEWASEYFKFKKPDMPVVFDFVSKKYKFNLENLNKG